jgi:hypothetical protein
LVRDDDAIGVCLKDTTIGVNFAGVGLDELETPAVIGVGVLGDPNDQGSGER